MHEAIEANARAFRVLIVSQERIVPDTLQIILKTHGYECDVVRDGVRAIEAALCLRPDVVLMEIVMPGGMYGAEAALQIWNNYPEASIIFTTGARSSEDLLLPLKAMGFPTDVLYMPIQPQDLLDRLADLRMKRLENAASPAKSVGTRLT